MPLSLAQQIREMAEGLGFALAGFAPIQRTERGEYIVQWLNDGKHGQMHYMANNLPVRLDPAQLLPDSRAIICVADQYAHAAPENQPTQEPFGRIARYAWGDDYHKVIKKRLFQIADQLREQFPDEQFKTVVDTAPLLEREHAERAGLGWIGKHTLLIHPALGSWLLLGAIVTTLPVEPDEKQTAITDHCGTCTRCIDACPTDCIEPYKLDASRCISYLTIEHRELIDEDLQQQMGDWVAGCDVCQEVCPHNTSGIDGMPLPVYQPRSYAHGLNLLELLNWEAEDRQTTFQGSALKRIKLDMLKRNALIAAGNYLYSHEDDALGKRIQELTADPSQPDLVRDTAKQVRDRLHEARVNST